MELRLTSLGGFDPLIYRWPYEFKDQGCEIIEAISFACQEEEPLKKFLNDILAGCLTNNYESMKMVCQRFNVAVDHLRSLIQSGLYSQQSKASVELLHHVIQTCYNRAVVDPEKLNHYEPFSAEVYGETSFELVHQMIQTIGFTEKDRFIDLGSGVGHVVLQVAAATPCKSCYGIEKAYWPALYAQQMSNEFEKWMKFYGKEFGSYELLKGNFLSDDSKDIICNATVIFVNNFAFGPQIDHELKLRFSNLKEGTKIVSSKAFCAMNMQISERNLSDIGAILTVEELSPLRGPVSWTPKRVTYYLHTIDRTQLEEYFRRRQNPIVKKPRKNFSSTTLKTPKQETSYQAKKFNSKMWSKKSLSSKRPSTISMLSTITASAPSRIYNGNIRSHLNESLNTSTSPLPCYVFPSAQALKFDQPETTNFPVCAQNKLHNLQTNIDATNLTRCPSVTKTTPARYQLLTTEANVKMGFNEKSPFTPLSDKDIFLEFCSDDNDLEEELKLEIDNIISLFHHETTKITSDEDYKPNDIFNDPKLVKEFSESQVKNCKDPLSILDNFHPPSRDYKNGLNIPSPICSPSVDNHNSAIQSTKNFPLLSSLKTPKFSVSLPRFSPITPETPTNSLENQRCVRKCIPFSFLGKINDLSGHTITNNVHFKTSTKPIEFNSDLNGVDISSVAIGPVIGHMKLDSSEDNSWTHPPSAKPLLYQPNLLCFPPIRDDESGSLNGQQQSSSQNICLCPCDSLIEKQENLQSNIEHSSENKSVPVSLPRQILNNSQLSNDEPSILLSNVTTNSRIPMDDDDDADSPELLSLLDTFKRQYKSMSKAMKSVSFKNKLMEALEYEKSRQLSLQNQIWHLNGELCTLQYRYGILNQKRIYHAPEKSNNDPQTSLVSLSISNSPGPLDQALCLDDTSNQNDLSSVINTEHYCSPLPEKKGKLEDEDEEVCNLWKINDTYEDAHIQSPDLEMPLLLPETNEIDADQRSNQHSNFCPPPELTVCVDDVHSNASNFKDTNTLPEVLQSTRSSRGCDSQSALKQFSRVSSQSLDKPVENAMCFSPISSCGSESPLRIIDNFNSEIDFLSLHCDNELSKSLSNPHPFCVTNLSNMYYPQLPGVVHNSFHAISNDRRPSCENVEPPSDKKRKFPDGTDNASRIKRINFSNEMPPESVSGGCTNNTVLRNLLNSKGLPSVSSVDSRSDSRDSGYEKDSETDGEATNKLNKLRDIAPPIGMRVPSQEPSFYLHNDFGRSQNSYSNFLPIGNAIPNNPDLVNGFNSREIYHHLLAHGGQNSYFNNHQNTFHYSTGSANWGHLNNSQFSRHSGSYELSFASLANYYETFLSEKEKPLNHDNCFGTRIPTPSSNHFSLLKRDFSSEFT